ncbi:anaerobic C4-dicarboxylate transporter [Microbacterium gorillae]|uniref:anaerobic C4-dicarboxylate transporter n=1 Tax=Microbacterium gorillae TaxID=1231063 RepID=UPI0005903328|nr:anaerobic C4-dicarboxylate transporter [Microbacterium gorillae]
MDILILILELLVVVGAIFMGTRTSGIGLGTWGLVGTAIIVFVFQQAPGAAPVDAVFIVLTVVTAASVMQAAGGIDWLVSIAAKAIRSNPKMVTFAAPFFSFIFTVGAGTGNIFYPLIPVIYDVAYQQRIRPERPLAVAAVASQVGIICSPVSAAVASMVVLLVPHGFQIGSLLAIMWPASIVGLAVAALVMLRKGKDLDDDPEFQRRLADGRIEPPADTAVQVPKTGPISAVIFLIGVLAIIAFGFFDVLRPVIETADDGTVSRVSVAVIIQVVMGLVAGLIFLICRVPAANVPKQSTFPAGVVGAIALFGIAWLANTFVKANEPLIVNGLGSLVAGTSAFLGALIFALVLFLVAMLTTSQSSATNAIVPIGLTIGLTASTIAGLWPAVMGIYALPANGSQVATAGFDQTGTTTLGKYVVDHSFQLPNLVFIVTACVVGTILATFIS